MLLAEGVGFEPTIRFPVYTLSKRAPSATRPSLRSAARGSASYAGGRTIVAGRALASVVACSRRAGFALHFTALGGTGAKRPATPRGPEAPPGGLAKLPANPHCPRTMADDDYLLRPDPLDPRLTERVRGVDQTGAPIETAVTVERALTIFLNAQEIVTAMTINDYPEYLALGYLLNQNMLAPSDTVTGVDYDEELGVVVVRTAHATNYEAKLKKKVQTSGCAQGTVFGDLMEVIEQAALPPAPLRTSWLYRLANHINTTPSLYLEAGAIHGSVLAQEDRPLVYMEDVGRHNAVDKIAGYMFRHASRRATRSSTPPAD